MGCDPTARAASTDRHPLADLAAKIPCRTCGAKTFWESVYLDGELRCTRCEPIPNRELVGWLAFLLDDGTWQQRAPIAPRRRESDGAAPSGPTLADAAGGDAEGPGEVAGEVAGHLASGLATDGGSRESLDPDLFVDVTLADGRRAYARRGWDNPRSPWFSQRLCMAAAAGWDAADRLLDDLQADLRQEFFGRSSTATIDRPREMKRIAEAGAETPAS